MHNPGGKVDLQVDVATGMIHVTVTPPFGLEGSAVTAQIAILDFFDLSANLTIQLNKLQRQAMAQIQLARPQ